MKYFNESTAYWGNTSEKIIGAGGDRFTLRSVKFVVDGMFIRPRVIIRAHVMARCLEVWRKCRKLHVSVFLDAVFNSHSYTNRIQTTPTAEDICVLSLKS